MGDFQKLAVWRLAHALALNVHRAATDIRNKDYSSLKSQMIRAAFSIPTNIVEGSGQRSTREFARFVRIAINSACELEYHLMIARDIHVISQSDFNSLSAQTIQARKMLHGLLNRLTFSSRTAAPGEVSFPVSSSQPALPSRDRSDGS